MAKNGKSVQFVPATSFAEVAKITGIDPGKISRYAHTGSTHGLKTRDLDSIFAAAGGQDKWQAIVVSALHLADQPATANAATATAGL